MNTFVFLIFVFLCDNDCDNDCDADCDVDCGDVDCDVSVDTVSAVSVNNNVFLDIN